MGQFANMLFSGLLGWVQTVVSGLWRLGTNADVSSWFRWVLDNWLPLTLILCAAGLIIDFLIYLIRWQPYRVWGGFLRRMTGRSQPEAGEENSEEESRYQRKWAYADGTTIVEDVRQLNKKTGRQEESEQLEQPVHPVRRAVRPAAPEKSYYQPVYPPQWQKSTKENSGGNE